MSEHPHSHAKAASSLPRLEERLREKSRKITGPRHAVLQVLQAHPHPLSNKEIFAELPAGGCDLVTVYRSVRLLESMGMVKRFDFGDGVARYELLPEGDDGHHHHMVCTQCAEVVEIDECFAKEIEERVAGTTKFKAVTHKLEFFGICPSCQ